MHIRNLGGLTTQFLKFGLYLFCAALSLEKTFASTYTIQAVTFDHYNSTGASSGVVTVDTTTNTVTDFQFNGDAPEYNEYGVTAAWLENGTDIKAVIFDKYGSGVLTSTGVLSLGTAGGTVSFFQLTGGYPEDLNYGSALAWLENGTEIKAILFSQNGSGALTTTGIVSLGSASGVVTSLQITGDYPSDAGYGVAVAWVENGTDIKAITFDQVGSGDLTTSGVISLGTATGTVTNFQLSGNYPEHASDGAVVAWLENGNDIKTIIFDQNGSGALTNTGVFDLGTASGTVSHFQLAAGFPETPGSGAIVAWLENGTDIKAIIYDKDGLMGVLTTTNTISVATATAGATVTNMELATGYPEFLTYGSVIGWVENGTNIKAITFDKNGSGALTSSGIISLGTAASTVSAFQVAGQYPEYPMYGAVVAWVESGTNIKAVTFEKDGSGALITSGILPLGTATGGAVSAFYLAGINTSYPEYAEYGAAVGWLVAPPPPVGLRDFRRPSNRR